MRWLSVLGAHPIGRLGRAVRFRVWLGLLAAVALVLAFTPLFDVLGFEFAFAFALAGSLAAADLGAWVVRRARTADHPGGGARRSTLVLLGRASALALATLAPPLAIIALVLRERALRRQRYVLQSRHVRRAPQHMSASPPATRGKTSFGIQDDSALHA